MAKKTRPSISAVSISPKVGPVGTEFSASVTAGGFPPIRYLYQWRLDSTNIADASGATYVASKAGSLTVLVTATNSQGTDSRESQVAQVTVPLAVPLAKPAIAEASISPQAGTVGDVFTVSATASGSPAPTLGYQWTLNGVAIGGATAAAYMAAGEGSLGVVVTASNPEGTDTRHLEGVPVGAGASAPSISEASISPGSGVVGDIFTIGAKVQGNPMPTTSFRWRLNGVNISGATASTFRATSEGRLSALVTATNSAGSVSLESAAVAVAGLQVSSLFESGVFSDGVFS